MDLAERYRTAVQAGYDATGRDPALLPRVLSQACVAVLPVSGASISVTQGLRIPLGSSDRVASVAERAQTTLGEGPCLDATRDSVPLTAGLDQMAARWPLFHAELMERTPYRSVASMPLMARSGRRLGALDVYRTDEEPVAQALLHEMADHVADPAAEMLAGAPIGRDAAGITMPVWLNSDVAQERMEVWSAVGQLMARSELQEADALALLRSHAFGRGRTLDEVAHQVTSHSLDVSLLLPR